MAFAHALSALSLSALSHTRWLSALERRLIFAPPQTRPRPDSGALRRADDSGAVWITFRSATTNRPAVLHGEWHTHRNAAAPALLFLHGARADLGDSAERIRHMNAMGFAVLAIDYRGFGKSGRGLPSEASAYEDARAAWRWLALHHPQRARYVFGHSLGGAVAIHLAAEVDDAAGLIVDSSFTSLSDVVQRFHWGWRPVLRRITQRFEAARKIAAVRAPVLVVHGEHDTLVPPALGRQLCDSVSGPRRFLLVPGASHHDTHSVGKQRYRQALHELFGVRA